MISADQPLQLAISQQNRLHSLGQLLQKLALASAIPPVRRFIRAVYMQDDQGIRLRQLPSQAAFAQQIGIHIAGSAGGADEMCIRDSP